MSRQRGSQESAKYNIRSRIASTVPSASIPDNNSTNDVQQAPKRLKNDNIDILPADKGLVTVGMDKTDYFDKMDALVNGKQTYGELKRDPTSALKRKLNSKILTLTAPFNNMRTSKFKAQPTNAFFATVNQMFGGSSQLSTTAERVVIKSLSTVQTTKQCSAVFGSWEEP